jgi:CheY-like chemotaxis protein
LVDQRGELFDTHLVPRRVLIVDDIPDITSTLSELVVMMGHDVRAATHGEQALEVAAEFGPDLVLLDLGMPDPDGFEVARRLRASARGGEIELVAMSGWGHQDARDRAVAAGFDRHFLKPITASHLRAVLELGTTRQR